MNISYCRLLVSMTPCVKINATIHATAATLFVTWDQGPYRPRRTGVCHTICMSYATDILMAAWCLQRLSTLPADSKDIHFVKTKRIDLDRESVLVLVVLKTEKRIVRYYFWATAANNDHNLIEGASHWLGEA